MNKKLKKMLATISAVAVCAVSMTAMISGAIYTSNPGITQYTVSFTINDTKYVVWQEMIDYCETPNCKYFISEDGSKYFGLDGNEIFTWGWYGYDFKNDEDLVAFKNYLADNSIEYEEKSMIGAYVTNIRLVGYKFDECFQISKKIKEDTGLIQMRIIPEDLVTINATDVVNELPEVTLAGDANEDGEVNISDAVLIMQSIANPEEFALTWQGVANADVYGDGDGVTLMDAFTIQEMSLNKSNA